jgi:uncharacterized Zn finger protein (UPF0148 family)
MSDFDKEAEREKLRRKYEADEDKREATEKMSELLLQGATMTNAHCSECGDPIFRYEGQEFCATCERAVDRGDTGAAEGGDDGGDGEDRDGGAPEEQIEVTEPDAGARVQFGQGEAEQSTDDAGPTQSEQTAPGQPDAPPETKGVGGGAGRSQPAPAPPNDGTAAANLRATLERMSQAAAQTDDPREAEAYLSAAREAAEALSALRR